MRRRIDDLNARSWLILLLPFPMSARHCNAGIAFAAPDNEAWRWPLARANHDLFILQYAFGRLREAFCFIIVKYS